MFSDELLFGVGVRVHFNYIIASKGVKIGLDPPPTVLILCCCGQVADREFSNLEAGLSSFMCFRPGS